MAFTSWLIAKSALIRLAQSDQAAEWASRIFRGLVRISTVTRLEVGFSARTGNEKRTSSGRPPLSSTPVEYLTRSIEDRAVAVQAALADRGLHRAASIPDLLLAATAELAKVIVLHVDRDFELIAELTRQRSMAFRSLSAAESR